MRCNRLSSRLHATLLCGGALLVLAIAGCARTPPEEALRATVDSFVEAIEQRDAGRVKDLLAEDFAGPGGLDRTGATRLAQGIFFRHPSIGVTNGPLEIRLEGDSALVRFSTVVSGGSGSLAVGEAARYEVVAGFRLESGDWRLASIDWK